MLAAAFCTACADVDFTDSPTDSGEAVNLTSTKLHVITRAGDEIETFYPGTVYRLFAVQHAAQEADYKWSAGIKSDGDAAIMYGMTGRESNDHDIVYNDGVNFNYATGKNADCLDFFAITVDNVDKDHHFEEDLPKFDSLARVNGVSPTVEWEVGQCSAVSTQPGDLMFSNDQKQKSYQDGAVTMNFRHALTRFTFQAAVQDESDYTDKWLKDNVTLTGIEVHGTHNAGTFNICTGTWSYTAGSNTKIAACGTEKLGKEKLTTSAEDVGESLLIFPNNDEVLEMVVKLHFDSKPADQDFSSNEKRVSVTEVAGGGYDVTVTTPLTLGEVENVTDAAQKDKAVEFASNYSYLFSIVVMRNDVRVLAIVPTVYDWMDDELTYETVVGQPVTFGGLMWMDRNLGASTWDAENDFYGSIGYYYQYGRNIPYILDTLQFAHYVDDNDVDRLEIGTSDGYPVIKRMNANHENNGVYQAWYKHHNNTDPPEDVAKKLELEQVNCVYTYYSENSTDTVCGYTYIASEDEQQPFRYVGQVIYKSDGKTMDIDQTKKYHRFAVVKETTKSSNYQRWTYQDKFAETYWSANVDDQPCPKGWRLPTPNDLYAFMPWVGSATSNKFIEWGKFDYPTDTTFSISATSKSNYNHPGWNQYLKYGKITNDDGSTQNVVYMLNRNGIATTATEAYRIRIKTHFSKGYIDRQHYSQNKRYIKIDRYTADPSKDLNDYFEEDEQTEKVSEWNDPIESLIYPCAGYIVTDVTRFDLRTFGTGSVLRTALANEKSNNSYSWVHYMSLSNQGASVNAYSRRSLGDQIRCCRDITAQ
jgi:hypothetical protein